MPTIEYEANDYLHPKPVTKATVNRLWAARDKQHTNTLLPQCIVPGSKQPVPTAPSDVVKAIALLAEEHGPATVHLGLAAYYAAWLGSEGANNEQIARLGCAAVVAAELES